MDEYKQPKKWLVIGGLVVIAVSVIVFCVLLRGSWYCTARVNSDDYVVQVPKGFAYEIEAVPNSDGLELTGWCAIKDVPYKDVNNWVVLYDKATGEYLRLPTQMRLDDEATKVIKDGSNHSFGGFFAVTDIEYKQIADKEICFEMVSHDSGTARLIHTDKTIKEVIV